MINLHFSKREKKKKTEDISPNKFRNIFSLASIHLSKYQISCNTLELLVININNDFTYEKCTRRR